jgi:hypothetical protein
LQGDPIPDVERVALIHAIEELYTFSPLERFTIALHTHNDYGTNRKRLQE